MTYTELLFKPGYADARVKECKKNLLQNRGTDDLLGYGGGLSVSACWPIPAATSRTDPTGGP